MTVLHNVLLLNRGHELLLTTEAPRMRLLRSIASAGIDCPSPQSELITHSVAIMRSNPTTPRLLAQGSTTEREAADRIRRVDNGRQNRVYPLPLVGDREVIGTGVDGRRAFAVESRSVTLPANIFGKAAVACSCRGIIIRDFAGNVEYKDGRRRSVHREVGLGLSEFLTQVPLGVVRYYPDLQDAERSNY